MQKTHVTLQYKTSSICFLWNYNHSNTSIPHYHVIQFRQQA